MMLLTCYNPRQCKERATYAEEPCQHLLKWYCWRRIPGQHQIHWVIWVPHASAIESYLLSTAALHHDGTSIDTKRIHRALHELDVMMFNKFVPKGPYSRQSKPFHKYQCLRQYASLAGCCSIVKTTSKHTRLIG